MTEVLQKQAATLYKLPRFRTAFHNVILYSLRSNGYYDYRYISRSITRADVLAADTLLHSCNILPRYPIRHCCTTP